MRSSFVPSVFLTLLSLQTCCQKKGLRAQKTAEDRIVSTQTPLFFCAHAHYPDEIRDVN
jgi:hypothetical protein